MLLKPALQHESVGLEGSDGLDGLGLTKAAGELSVRDNSVLVSLVHAHA